MRRLETKEYRVYGPPGTGKTTWIVDKATACVDQYGEDQVSLCSLTNTAVKEVAGRKLPVDEDNVSTLHARCKRALGAPAPAESKVKEFAKAYPQYARTDGYRPALPPSLLRGVKDEDGEDMAETVYAGSRELSLYEEAQINRQQLIPMSQWGSDVRKWFSVWNSWCEETGNLDFTGWLETALKVRPLPAQQVVFVDEAQDHTPLQLAVIRSWNCRARVLVGDDDQNLYEWSGAIPQEFFGSELPEGREKVLEQSYRVPRAVHAMATRWSGRISSRKEKVYKPRPADGSVREIDYRFGWAEQDGELPEGILENPEQTYMILGSCGYMVSGVVEALKHEGIAFHNPYRRTNARWNPLDSPGQRIDAFLAAQDRPEKTWLGAEIVEWAKVLKSRGVFRTGMKDGFIAQCEGMAGKLIPHDLLHQFIEPRVLDRLVAGDLAVFGRDRQGGFRKAGVPGSWDYAMRVFQQGREYWRPRVIVGTIHSVKGGQADNVYLFPDLSGPGYNDYVGHRTDRVLRLFYVGMTRARENLILCQPNSSYRSVFWR